MTWATIVKSPDAAPVAPSLLDYERVRATFAWAQARAELDGLPGGRGLNIAHEAVDRHAAGARRDRVALRWLGKRGEVEDITYGRLSELTARFANVLRGLGVAPGERVYALAGRIPALYVAALGALKARAVFCPLFSAFGPEPIRPPPPAGRGGGGGPTAVPDTRDWHALMNAAADRFEIEPTDPEDTALLHFTSGTTGTPKGAVHVHEAVVAHHVTGRWALDLHPEDVFWCTADPGWVTGTSYGIVAPLTNGVTSVVDEAEFDAERWYRILQEQRVSVWYTAPTAIRMLMRQPIEPRKQYDLSPLRFVASVGEPLNPEAVVWGQQALGLPIHDNWWQTETGGIMIANFASQAIRPGSMGRPLPGIEAAIVARRPDGGVGVIAEPEVTGELALRAGWPSMFRGY